MSDVKEELKKNLTEELRIKTALLADGVRFDPEIFKEEIEKDPNIVATHNCMDFSQDDTVGVKVPSGGRTANGIGIPFQKNQTSPYSVIKEDGRIFIINREENEKLLEIEHLTRQEDFAAKKTSDGVYMRTIATGGSGVKYGEGQIVIAYSNECALIEKGKDCLFCNINATKARFAERECIQWKNPRQIAETVKAAYADGCDHLTITGGFIPERREVEYYIDAAEAIADELGTDTFNGTACIGAPVDLSVIEKYKEAGFSSIGINMEVWNKNYFEAICPGKCEVCGGYEHWIDAIKYAVDVFGKGNVRSNFVPGLEPKEYLLEGIEKLAELGVVATGLIPWSPNIGSAFEGHRTPTAEWHWEVQQRIYHILRQNGITYQNLYNATPSSYIIHDLYRIDDETSPAFANL